MAKAQGEHTTTLQAGPEQLVFWGWVHYRTMKKQARKHLQQRLEEIQAAIEALDADDIKIHYNKLPGESESGATQDDPAVCGTRDTSTDFSHQ